MLSGNESDLQRMMDRLNMVSANCNMKINTKKTKVLRVSKGSESDNEDNSCRGNYRTSQGILLLIGSMISDDATSEKSREGLQQQRRQYGLKCGGRGSGSKKFRFLHSNFRKISIFSGNFTKEYRVLQVNFRKF